MTPFLSHTGLAVALPRANIDTDVIIRIERCAQHPREELGAWAFESLRRLPDGTSDPACVFNDPAFSDASILLAGDNFGCGSSREMAVWALAGMGLRCVIAPGFGDIFYANCFQSGLLPIRLPADTVQALMARTAAGGLRLEVDLEAQSLRGEGVAPLGFEIQPLRKSMLMRGMDEISMTLTHADAITRWQDRDRAERPWVYAPLHI